MNTPFSRRLLAWSAASRPRQLRTVRGIASSVAIAAAAVTATGCGHGAPGVPGAQAAAAPRPAGETTTGSVAPTGWSMIATAKGTIPKYTAPGREQDGTVAARWHGARSALPVIGSRPGWYKVRLVTRPNGSAAWVRAADVTVTGTPYRIVVNLMTRHLKLFRLGRQIMNAPAAIGTSQDPTPVGHYFVAMFERSPSPGYGPFILVTSAHSTAISDWAGSGDAVIGIHGPLGDARLFGTSAAALSHGCIRLRDSDLSRLRRVPVGTPITITG